MIRLSRAMAVWEGIGNWSRRRSLGRKLAFALTLAALGFAFATYAAITGSSPLGADTRVVLILLQIDLVLFLKILGIVNRFTGNIMNFSIIEFRVS